MDNKDGLQLLPGTKKRLGIKVPGENRFLYVGSAFLGAVIVASLWLNFSTKSLQSNLKLLDDQIVSLDQKRNKQSEANIRTIQRQLALTSKLIEGHMYFSQALLKISSLIQDKIRTESLSVDPDGQVSFSGISVNYTIVARQMAVFLADDSVIDMTLGRIESQLDGTVKFSMQVKFNPAVLFQNKK